MHFNIQDERAGGVGRFRQSLRLVVAQLAAAALVLLASPVLAQPQNPMFTAPGLVVNPAPGTNNASPIFVDIDNDGDLDAFVGTNDGTTNYYANTGTATDPVYGMPVNPAFGLLDVGTDAAPDFADIDNDGDLDAFVGNSVGDVWYQPNTGTAMAPLFGALVVNPFGILNAGTSASPYLVDIDGDMDLDIFIGNGAGDVRYQQNGGTVLLAAFGAAAINPFGLANVGTRASPVFADLDNDGDFDALVGGGDGVTTYFQNGGTTVAPAFATPMMNPLGLSDVGINASPDLADIDGDGDLDALIGEGGGNTILFRNTGSAAMPMFAGSLAVDVGLWSAPTFGDLDGDGDLDAIVGASGAEHFYFQNTGSAGAPSFAPSQMNPFGLVSVPGSESAPNLADFDGDGDLDVLTGNAGGATYLYTNVGGSLAPAFAAPVINPNGLVISPAGFGATPFFVDIDADGDLDAMIGGGDGNTYYYPNTGTVMVPAYGPPQTNPFGLANSGGGYAAPAMVDIDNDGDFDAMIGGADGNTHVYLNVGLPGAPSFGAANVSPFGLVDVGAEASPAFPDIDNDGDLDAFLGSTAGTTLFFENLAIDTPIIIMCGNGMTEMGEQCDDGNTMSGDGCSATCQSEGPVCGDMMVEAPETCDDGNTTSGDGCSATCMIEVCGDGILARPTEECDDGNTVAMDECDAMCMHEACGDGMMGMFEQCDDGNTVANDGCDASCFLEPGVCGDGMVDAGEECDDGNTIDDDACSNTCMPPPCAEINGVVKAVKVGLKFNKPLKDKIDIKIKDWTLPQGTVAGDMVVDLGGAVWTGTVDVKGKAKTATGKVQMKPSKKTGLFKLTVKRNKQDFAMSLEDDGLVNAENPKPGVQVMVPMRIEVGGLAYCRDMNLTYKSKLGKKGTAKN